MAIRLRHVEEVRTNLDRITGPFAVDSQVGEVGLGRHHRSWFDAGRPKTAASETDELLDMDLSLQVYDGICFQRSFALPA